MLFVRVLRSFLIGYGSFPDDFVAEVLVAEDGVQSDFEIVRGGRIAVQIKRASRFQYAFQADQPLGHINQISQQLRIGVSQRFFPRKQNIHDDLGNALLIGELGEVLEGALRVGVQLPHIAKGFDLGGQRPAGGVFVNGVVKAVAIEGRV